ncbi:MAG: DNA-binding response regulator [Ignavibacteriae bacterium HGW-Ignavibacteriae-2]|nr:MAG: DNA-binding response regulator [Ignavibacteriae bacterium HGW-Ignavibacteriae-2]
MIKIFICDDHALTREGLSRLFSLEIDLELVGESSNPNDLLDFIQNNECDVIVLDISFPGKSGLDVLKDIKAIKPDVKVLILSMYPEEQFAKRTLKSGAMGYLNKESAPEEIINAVRKIAGGRKYISESLAEKLAFDLDDNSIKKPHELLSDREFQVLQLISSGKIAKEIAEELNLGITTVSTYRSRILQKLNLKSNADIIRYAFLNNLIE